VEVLWHPCKGVWWIHERSTLQQGLARCWSSILNCRCWSGLWISSFYSTGLFYWN
jgi:hypothetical protein